MRKSSICGFFIVTLFQSHYAAAEEARYFSLQYANASYSEAGFSELSPKVLLGRLGNNLSENYAIEGRIGIGVTDDSLIVSGLTLSLDIDTIVGIYAIGRAPISDALSLYGTVGLTRFEATVSALGYSYSDDDTDMSFGAGIDFSFAPNAKLNAEYISYLDETAYELSALSVGATISY